MPNDNLQKLNNYFEKYIDEMLIRDIELIKARNDEFKFSYPYLLLVCSCIDLFGGIEKGFKSSTGQGNSRERFEGFITEWMSKVNLLYKEESLAYLIYDSWRSGVMHQATLKKGFETSSYLYSREKHLHYIKESERIFIHSLQFADDLIEAQKLYRQHISDNANNSGYIELLYTNLRNMFEEVNVKKEQKFDELKKILEDKNLVIDDISDIEPSRAPEESDLD